MKKIIYFLIALMFLTVTACSKSAEFDEKNLLNDNEIQELFSDPNKFKGKSVILTGKVFVTPEKDKDITALQVYHNVVDYSQNFIVHYDGDTDFKLDNYIKVEGVVEGTFSGENAFGGEVNAPLIKAKTITKSDYKNVVSTSIDEFDINKSVKQNNITLTLQKIDFAKEETRAYIKITNDSKKDINFYELNSNLIIDDAQYTFQENYDSDYKKVDSDISKGVSVDGVITFKHIKNYKNQTIKFTFDIYSNDFDIDLKPFTIESKLQ